MKGASYSLPKAAVMGEALEIREPISGDRMVFVVPGFDRATAVWITDTS